MTSHCDIHDINYDSHICPECYDEPMPKIRELIKESTNNKESPSTSQDETVNKENKE